MTPNSIIFWFFIPVDFLRFVTWPLCGGTTGAGVTKPTRWGAAPRGFRTARRLIKACAKHLALIESWPLNDSSGPDRSSSHPGSAAEVASLRLLEEKPRGKVKKFQHLTTFTFGNSLSFAFPTSSNWFLGFSPSPASSLTSSFALFLLCYPQIRMCMKQMQRNSHCIRFQGVFITTLRVGRFLTALNLQNVRPVRCCRWEGEAEAGSFSIAAVNAACRRG